MNPYEDGSIEQKEYERGYQDAMRKYSDPYERGYKDAMNEISHQITKRKMRKFLSQFGEASPDKN